MSSHGGDTASQSRALNEREEATVSNAAHRADLLREIDE